jgi:hypothetical protein
VKGRRHRNPEITGHDCLGMMTHKGPPSCVVARFPRPGLGRSGTYLCVGHGTAATRRPDPGGVQRDAWAQAPKQLVRSTSLLTMRSPGSQGPHIENRKVPQGGASGAEAHLSQAS